MDATTISRKFSLGRRALRRRARASSPARAVPARRASPPRRRKFCATGDGLRASSPRHKNAFNFAVGNKGLFLILDYPEEQPARTAAVLKDLAERKTAPYPLRTLFLSRRSFAEWEGEATMLQGRFGGQEIAAPATLGLEDGARLIEEAAGKLAERMGRATPDLGGARTWLAASPLNRLPLYATAAAIHTVLSPCEAFGLSGGELLRKLAARELDRVRPASESLGLGRKGLETLLALGVLADGLSEKAVTELARAGACRDAGADLIPALAGSPWWRRGRLMRLEPDAPAAAFVDRALFGSAFQRGRDVLPDWLFVALRENAASFGGRLVLGLTNCGFASFFPGE